MIGNFKLFCETTSLHGYAYTVSGRSRAETAFWAITVFISLLGAGLICYDAFYTWTEQPVVNVIKSFKYDTSKIPAPAITICPNQYLDELYHISVLLNQLEFRCMANSYDEHIIYEGLNSCDKDHIKALRNETSPFYTFLEQLKLLVKHGVDNVGGEIDWASLGIDIIPLKDSFVKDLLVATGSQIADYNKIPSRPEMPLDEEKWTLHNLKYICEAVGEGHPNFVRDFSDAVFPGQQEFDMENFDRISNGLGGIQESLLEAANEDFYQVGYLRGLKHKYMFVSGYSASQSNNTGFKIGQKNLWRDITKSNYFISKLADVGLGSLIRQYLPHMLLKNLPLSTDIDPEILNTITRNLTAFAKDNFKFSPIEYALAFDNRHQPAAYISAQTEAHAKGIAFTEESITDILTANRYAFIGYPTRQYDQVGANSERFFTGLEEFRLQNNVTINTTSPQAETYQVPHYLDSLITDTDTNPVYVFLLMEAEATIAFGELIKMNLGIGEAEVRQMKSYQAGKTSNGLNMIPYSSESSRMKQAPTVFGICSVLHGGPLENLMRDNDMLPYLKAFIDVPEEYEERKYSDLSPMLFLLDIHSTDIKKSLQDDNHFMVTFGSPETYVVGLEHHLVLPGTTSSFKISVQVQSSDEDIKLYSQKKKGCRFRDENPNEESFFRTYSREGCVYECALKRTQMKLNISCVPWDIPYPFKLEQTSICQGQAAALFKAKLLDEQHKCLDKCSEGCEGTAFSVSTDIILTDVDLACRDKVAFSNVQNAEQMNEFAFSKSVEQKYLLGHTLPLKYCHMRMLKDIAILKLQFSSTMVVLSNRERIATVWDQFGLIGGSLGLFSGFSFMVLMEVVQLITHVIFSSLRKRVEHSQMKPGLFKVVMLYLGFSSIHGMQFIQSSQSLPGKLIWVLVLLTCLGFSSVLSRFATIDFEENQVIRSLDIDSGNVTDLIYPTITICPVQLNDNWNLAHGIINTKAFEDKVTGKVSMEVFDKNKDFFELLTSHIWIHESDVNPDTVTNLDLFHKLLPYFVFNRDSELLSKKLAKYILNGNLEKLDAKVVKKEDFVQYEIDLGETLTWYSVGAYGTVKENVLTVFGSNSTDEAEGFSTECHYFELKIAENVYQLECEVPVTSQYIIVKASKAMERIGPATFTTSEDPFAECNKKESLFRFHFLFIECRSNEAGFLLPGYYSDHICYYSVPDDPGFINRCPFETYRIRNKKSAEALKFWAECNGLKGIFHDCDVRGQDFKGVFCSAENFLEMYYAQNYFPSSNASIAFPSAIEICSSDRACKESLQRLWQLLKWFEFKPSRLGSLLHYFSETAIKGIFHPYGESQDNRMLLAQRSIEKRIMRELALLLADTFGADLDITLLEIPALLEPPAPSHRAMEPTLREIGSRQLHYSLMKLWENETFPEKNPSYSFYFKTPQRAEVPFPLGTHEGLVRGIFDNVEATMSPSQTHQLNLQVHEGASIIEKALKTNHFSHQLKSHLFNVMKVMRFSQVIGNIFTPFQQIATLLGAAGDWSMIDYALDQGEHLELFNYIPLTSGELIEKNTYLGNAKQYEVDPHFWIDNVWTRLEMIRFCEFSDLFSSSAKCRESIHHVLTANGICSAFNSVPTSVLYTDDHVFVKEFNKLYNTPVDKKNFFMIPGPGRNHKLSLILDVHQTDVFGSESGYFTLAINSYFDEFSMNGAFEVYPAQKSDVYIDITVVDSASDVQSTVKSEDRKCRYRNEHISKQSTYRHYTQKTCQFECQLSQAKKTTDCIPWNIFHKNEEIGIPICTRWQVEDFEQHMLNSSITCLQGCPENCEELIYDYSIDRFLINPGVACMDSHLVSMSLLGIHEKHDLFFWEYQRRNAWYYSTYREHLPITQAGRCIQKVSLDYAFVDFAIASDTAAVYVMERKYEYVDQLSIIGGTLGLWTGFSLISVIEFCFWIFVAMTVKVYMRRTWTSLPGQN